MNIRNKSIVFTGLMVVLSSIAVLHAPLASAGIIKIKSEQSCSVTGLDDETTGIRNGVHCDVGDTAFSLADVLNGTIGLLVGDSKTPSWNLINDTGAALTSLTLFYSGQLAQNAFIDMQVDAFFDECSSTDDNGVTQFVAGDCKAKTNKPEDDPGGLVLPLEMTWSGGTGIALNGIFNLSTASFANAGQDAGCFSGTKTCEPSTQVPEPAILALLGLGLFGLGFSRRLKQGKGQAWLK